MNQHTPPVVKLAVNAKTVAQMLSISPRMVRYLTADGDIPSFKIGARRLYRLVDLDTWLEAQVEGTFVEEHA